MASTDRSLSDRLFAVRSALGTTRKPLPFQALATLVEQHTGERVSWESLRRYEADGREPPLWIIRALAEIDPLERGAPWLAWGFDVASPPAARAKPARRGTT